MQLKQTLLKFLLFLFLYKLVVHILGVVLPTQMDRLGYIGLFTVLDAVIFIWLLQTLYKQKVTYKLVLAVVLLWPIVNQILQVGLGNIFIHFCPEEKNESSLQGLQKLFELMEPKRCNYQTTFYFFDYIYMPYFYAKRMYFNFGFFDVTNFLLSPYIFYPILFYKYCLYMLFKRHSKNALLSLIPIVNSIVLLKICKLPAAFILLLLLPFIRLFYFLKINKQLCSLENIAQRNAIWLTLLPQVFYGKLVYK
jgi:hypothetical protein